MNTAIKTFSVLLLALILGCSQSTTSDQQIGTADSTSLPDSELSDAKIYLYNRGQVKTEILAQRILKFVDLDSTMAYGVDVDIYDSTGKSTTRIVGDSGVIRETKGRVDIYGNVVVIADDQRLCALGRVAEILGLGAQCCAVAHAVEAAEPGHAEDADIGLDDAALTDDGAGVDDGVGAYDHRLVSFRAFLDDGGGVGVGHGFPDLGADWRRF